MATMNRGIRVRFSTDMSGFFLHKNVSFKITGFNQSPSLKFDSRGAGFCWQHSYFLNPFTYSNTLFNSAALNLFSHDGIIFLPVETTLINSKSPSLLFCKSFAPHLPFVPSAPWHLAHLLSNISLPVLPVLFCVKAKKKIELKKISITANFFVISNYLQAKKPPDTGVKLNKTDTVRARFFPYFRSKSGTVARYHSTFTG
jgi:hypothetical protein